MEQTGSSDQYAQTERTKKNQCFSVTSSTMNMRSGHAGLNLKLWQETSI